MLKIFLVFLLSSVAYAETLDPPTFYYELSAFPATANETVSSNILSASGLHTIGLTEAPGAQADWSIDWYLDDKTTVFQSTSFTNQSSTSDVDARAQVLSNWGKIYCTPAANHTLTAVIYGSHGSER